MKKIITILLSIIMVISLFACDDSGDNGTATYTGNLFGGEFVLKVNGDTVIATQKTSMNEDGIKMSMSMSFIGGKATTDGNTVSADFSGNITYELTLKISGENAAEYIKSAKEEFLENATTDADKQLIEALFKGETVRFGKDSVLALIAEGFTYLKATANDDNYILFNEIRYSDGSKYLYEYHESGALKSESYYDKDGGLVFSDEYDDNETDNGSNGDDDNTSSTQRPNDSQAQDSKHDGPSDPDVTDEKYPMSSDNSTYYPMPDTTEDGSVTLPPDANLVIPNVSDGGDYEGEIDLNHGVLFYMQGTFTGKYSGMDAVIDFPADKQPVFILTVNMNESGADIKQTIIVRNGKLIYHNGVLAIIDFEVEQISYTMSMEISGSGAAAYKQRVMNDLNSSNMSASDKQLYKDVLDGKEITFGKNSELYKGMKLPVISFKLKNDLTFEANRFDIDENQGGKLESSTDNIYDSLTNIGSATTTDSNASDSGQTATKDDRNFNN